MGGCDIAIWVNTGDFVFREDDDKSCDSFRRTTKDYEHEQGDDDFDNSRAEMSSAPDELHGADNDLLKPSNIDIYRVYHDGKETWTQFVREAESFPKAFGNPYIMLKDVPPLPKHLPKSMMLHGQPIWFLPDAEGREGTAVQPEQPKDQTKLQTARGLDFDRELINMQHPLGVQRNHCLWNKKPIEFSTFSSETLLDPYLADGSNGMLVLTLCWSYIFSLRLLEAQNRKVRLSPDAPKPLNAREAVRARQAGHTVLNLTGGAVSYQMILWLRAILAQKPAWHPEDNRGLPVWTASCPKGVRFAFLVDEKYIDYDDDTDMLPNSTVATELLIEFCRLFGLGSTQRRHNLGTISPPTAAFLAVLTLPVFGEDLRPHFAVPKLRRRKIGTESIDAKLCQSIRQYTADLNYFITLSLDRLGAGSIMWSIFWQPDITCNLVGAWLGAIHDVIRPIIKQRDMQKLVKVFAVRRPRVAMWWAGIYLLGVSSVFDWISRYLETTEERWGFGTMSRPDPIMTIWTGIPNSYLDDDSQHPYRDVDRPVEMVHLLRHRYNFRLQDTATPLLSWRPFGRISRRDIEPELWPWLDRGHRRSYVNWIWWMKDSKGGVVRKIYPGFQQATGRFVANVPDRLDIVKSCTGQKMSPSDSDIAKLGLKLEPSRSATLLMLGHAMEDMSGDRDRNLTVVGVERHHEWLWGWRGV